MTPLEIKLFRLNGIYVFTMILCTQLNSIQEGFFLSLFGCTIGLLDHFVFGGNKSD